MGQGRVDVPTLRITPEALDRLGIYLARVGWTRISLVRSAGLPDALLARVRKALAEIDVAFETAEDEPSLDAAARLIAALPSRCKAVLAIGALLGTNPRLSRCFAG